MHSTDHRSSEQESVERVQSGPGAIEGLQPDPTSVLTFPGWAASIFVCLVPSRELQLNHGHGLGVGAPGLGRTSFLDSESTLKTLVCHKPRFLGLKQLDSCHAGLHFSTPDI